MAIGPIVDELAAKYQGAVKFVKVDAPNNLRVLQPYGVRSIPTLMVFKEGKRQGELIGKQSKEAIRDTIEVLK